MHIVLDARWIFRERSGIGIYTSELTKAMLRLAPQHRYTLLFQDPEILERTREDIALDDFPHAQAQIFSPSIFSLRSQWELPSLLKRMGADVFHSPNWMLPFRAFPREKLGRVAGVTTLHDLIPLVLPDYAPRSRKAKLKPIFKTMMREVVRRADAIITVSESSRRDIIHLLHAQPDLVHSVYNGVSPTFTPPHDDDPGDRSPIILYVGRLDPYKNVPALIEAFVEVRESLPPRTRLRIVAPEDPRYPEAKQIIQRLQAEQYMDWISNTSHEALAEEYRRASVLVLPSRYEGFGLPVVEAMASGTPVICSAVSSLPEVANTAGWLIHPSDPNSLPDALVQVMNTPNLRRAMSKAGLKQALNFSWDKCAKETLSVYQQALTRGKE